MSDRMSVVFLGLTITSSWGNGHATNYRALVRALAERGHDVVFLERDVPWYASHRDLPTPPYGSTELYGSVEELKARYGAAIGAADLVVVGSYVPDGVQVGEWVTSTARGLTAFYDLDTPVTIAKLERADFEYLSPDLIPRFRFYLSFTGGPTLDLLQRRYGARRAYPFPCLVDPDLLYPEDVEKRWDLGYLGTYGEDRQPKLESLLLSAARSAPGSRFVVAGPQYPTGIDWPPNVERIEHLAPSEHRHFYCSQRFTLNVTRTDMVQAGYSPSVRLFEAAACAVPVISDPWEGLDRYFVPDEEILVARTTNDTLDHLARVDPEEATEIGCRARRRVLAEHTAEHRVTELETYVEEARMAEASL